MWSDLAGASGQWVPGASPLQLVLVCRPHQNPAQVVGTWAGHLSPPPGAGQWDSVMATPSQKSAFTQLS